MKILRETWPFIWPIFQKILQIIDPPYSQKAKRKNVFLQGKPGKAVNESIKKGFLDWKNGPVPSEDSFGLSENKTWRLLGITNQTNKTPH